MGALYWIRIKRRPLIPMFYKVSEAIMLNSKVDLNTTPLYFNESCTEKWERDDEKDMQKHK
jgi:hypothetical protein